MLIDELGVRALYVLRSDSDAVFQYPTFPILSYAVAPADYDNTFLVTRTTGIALVSCHVFRTNSYVEIYLKPFEASVWVVFLASITVTVSGLVVCGRLTLDIFTATNLPIGSLLGSFHVLASVGSKPLFKLMMCG